MAGLTPSVATASPLFSLPPSSYRIFGTTFPQFRPFLLSPKPNHTKPLNITSRSLSLPLVRLLSHIDLLRSSRASDYLQTSIEADQEGELEELFESERDQLLEQEHEQEHEEEEEDDDEGDGETKNPAPSEDGRLYVGNLPYYITSFQLADIFVEAGAVRSAEIICNRVTGKSRGFAFVTMGSVEDAKKAIRMFDSSQIGGRTVKVNFPEVPMGGEQKVLETKNKTSYQSFMETPNKIYAGNLSWGVSSQVLRQTFSGQSGFLSAKVTFERETGKSRGFGFVSFSSAEEARAAITEMNGVELDGRPLRLNMASEKARPFRPSTVSLNSEEPKDQSEILSGVKS